MTKRHCYVADVGAAIEALASALDPERKPPFKGDILDLLEWAEKDVLEMRKQLEQWNEKAKNWMASPEAGKQLEGYRTMGAKCAELEAGRDQLSQQLAAKQAEVDALMLEYCPSEMSQEQLDNWAAHQRTVPEHELKCLRLTKEQSE